MDRFDPMGQRLQETWKSLACRLGLHVDCPFKLVIGSVEIKVPVRLRYFGGERGMLLVANDQKLQLYSDALAELGFGYCCFVEPLEPDSADDQRVMETLLDWGWAGKCEPPEWLESKKGE